MAIRVRGYLTFKSLIGDHRIELENLNLSLREVLRQINPEFSIGLDKLFDDVDADSQSQSVIILVNGRQLPNGLDTRVKDGDEISIFPPMMGG